MTIDLTPVILWLENGCNPREAAKELRIYRDRMLAQEKMLTPYEVLKDQFDELLAENRRMVAQQQKSVTPIRNPQVIGVSRIASDEKAVMLLLKIVPSDDDLQAIFNHFGAPPVAPELSDMDIVNCFYSEFEEFFGRANEDIVKHGRALIAKESK